MKPIEASKEHLSNEGAALVPVVPAGTLVMSFKLSIGRTAIAAVDLRTNEAIAAFTKLRDDVNVRYLGYALQEHDWGTGDGANDKLMGATLNKAKLSSAMIPIPPLDEQERIMAKLDQVTAEVSSLRQVLTRELREAFHLEQIHLDRVVAHQGLFTALMDLCEVVTDGDHQPPPKSDSGIPFITISCIDKNTRTIDLNAGFRVPKSYYEELAETRRPRTGDVLVTVTGSFGIPVVVREDEPFCFQRHIALLRPKSGVSSDWRA